jgi:23S rRNA (adenine2030-N6)-methyltransferase
MLSKIESRKLPDKLKRLGVPNWLNVTLEVSAPAKDGYGMNGSGLFIINPPWSLEKTLRETLPKLTELLSQGTGAQFRIDAEST